jgi:hypothetical protein
LFLSSIYTPLGHSFMEEDFCTTRLHNTCTTQDTWVGTMWVEPTTWGKMLDLQHQYNNCTTILHMRVGPTYWDLSSCEGLLYSCCIGVVQESNPPMYLVLCNLVVHQSQLIELEKDFCTTRLHNTCTTQDTWVEPIWVWPTIWVSRHVSYTDMFCATLLCTHLSNIFLKKLEMGFVRFTHFSIHCSKRNSYQLIPSRSGKDLCERFFLRHSLVAALCSHLRRNMWSLRMKESSLFQEHLNKFN